MNIIGHRGAAGVALENTEQSLKVALEAKVAGIEIDVRLTKDKQLVVCHDSDLIHIAQNPTKTGEATLHELQAIELPSKNHLLSLEEALRIIGDRAYVIVEIKDTGSASSLLNVTDRFPQARIRVASFNQQELASLKELRPELALYGLERTKPFDIIHFARALKLTGIGLNFWILNPLSYWLARRAGLDIYVYTVNKRFMVWFISLLYPKVAICTNYPHWFKSKPPRLKSKADLNTS